MDCASQKEGKLKLVNILVDEAGSWGRESVLFLPLAQA